jgi:hypothetical protein
MPEPLIHPGYHKTGSTWLQQNVFADPKLGFVRTETPIETDEAFVSVNPFRFDRARAAAMFEGLLSDASATGCVPVISHERLSGDLETGGVDSRAIADRLAETFPRARVLIVIREQRDMLLSIHKTELTFGTYTIERRWRDRTVIERRSPAPTLEYFEYHLLIGYYQELFGADRVLVLPYELLVQDALAFVSQISKFAGLSAPTGVPNERANPSLPALLLELNRWFNKLMRAIGLGATRFEGPLEERRAKRGQLKVLNRVSRYIPKGLSRPVDRRWRAAAERVIGDRYVESNRITAELTGLDLASFGYMVPGGR